MVRARRHPPAWTAAAGLLLGSLLRAQTPARPLTATEIKAQFLINFSRCVEWQVPAGSGAFRIGVLGDEAMLEALQPYEGQTVKGLRILLVRNADPQKLLGCHAIYLGEGAPESDRLLKQLRGQPALSFGDSASFHKAGGVVRFVQEGVHYRLVINRGALQDTGLKVNARLLAITTQIDP